MTIDFIAAKTGAATAQAHADQIVAADPRATFARLEHGAAATQCLGARHTLGGFVDYFILFQGA